MPFTRTDFFAVFESYNESVWPAQMILYLLGILIVLLAFGRSRTSSRLVYAGLAVFWLWMGVTYHAGFFAAVNPIALGFSIAFIVQASIFGFLAMQRIPPVIAPQRDASSMIGGGLVVLGLVVYPFISSAAGHLYPAMPTFGLPCPTTMFTLGILLWAREARLFAFLIPLAWAAIGSSSALLLGVPEDLSLALTILAVGVAWTTRRVNQTAVRHA